MRVLRIQAIESSILHKQTSFSNSWTDFFRQLVEKKSPAGSQESLSLSILVMLCLVGDIIKKQWSGDKETEVFLMFLLSACPTFSTLSLTPSQTLDPWSFLWIYSKSLMTIRMGMPVPAHCLWSPSLSLPFRLSLSVAISSGGRPTSSPLSCKDQFEFPRD